MGLGFTKSHPLIQHAESEASRLLGSSEHGHINCIFKPWKPTPECGRARVKDMVEARFPGGVLANEDASDAYTPSIFAEPTHIHSSRSAALLERSK
jgi:hypothetical protein